MSTPSEDLSALLVASESLPVGVSVYGGPTNQIVPPAIVIRPDEPWIEPDAFCRDLQRYVAIVVVSAASPEDGTNKMYAIAQGVVDAVNEAGEATPWEWVSTGAPIIDESTGTAFLASSVRLKYRNQ